MRLFSGPRGFSRLWRKDESGATAIEFAMVIGPFLGLLFAILEVALVYFAQFSLENANETAARLIRTGAAQNGTATSNPLSKSQFKQKVCAKLPAFMTCDNNLIVDIRSFPTFSAAAADLPDLFNPDGSRGAAEKYCPGGPSDMVVATIYYDWKLFIGMPGLGDFTGKLGLGLGNMPDGSRLIITGFATRNEPFAVGAKPKPPYSC